MTLTVLLLLQPHEEEEKRLSIVERLISLKKKVFLNVPSQKLHD